MCLSSWYAQNMGHAEELPYKPFNHPVVWQFNNQYTRRWAICNALNIFYEFSRRFNKFHASEQKLRQIIEYIYKYDDRLDPFSTPGDVYEYARFSFIEKGHSVDPGMSIDTAVARYRAYYLYKIQTMRVPVIWTAITRPWWLEIVEQ